MENYKKRNTILVIISALILIVIGLLISKATYSFLEPEDPDDLVIEGEITATGDTLLFSKGTDISVLLNTDNFGASSGNLVRSVTPRVQLIANNKTNNATATYYISANIKENTFNYTNGANSPEILLTVLDNDGNPLTTCTGLTYTTVGGVGGFDITDKIGVYDFPVQTISTTSSTTGTTKNWTFTVTFINKETDQSINEDAKITIQAVLHQETESYCELNPNFGGCIFTLSYNPVVSKNITLENGMIYYHDSSLVNGAGDYSYRYAGANPNNYVCFGSLDVPCPAANLYRIIGLMPVDVVTNSSTNPPTTERNMLWKLIKNDYATATDLGISSGGNVNKFSPYTGPSGNQPTGNVQGFRWANSSSYGNNWSYSILNNTALNTNFLTNMGDLFSSMIANVMWRVGGSDSNYIRNTTPISAVYKKEILESGIYVTNPPSNGLNEISAQVGLLYVTDYAYSVPQSNWNTTLIYYNTAQIIANNWLYKGVNEWTITRSSSNNNNVYPIILGGSLGETTYVSVFAVRPTFYLTEDTVIDMTNHAGTLADPYRIANVSWLYWNSGFNGTIYTGSEVPTGNGLYGTYTSREALAERDAAWSSRPVYIKSLKVIAEGQAEIIGHIACMWYNNHEFCITPNYWDTNVNTTKTKLKTDMSNALGITISDSSCTTGDGFVYCSAGPFDCMANSSGEVSCTATSSYMFCSVEANGNAKCADW